MHKPLALLPAALLLIMSAAAASLGLASVYRNEAASITEGWTWLEGEGVPDWAWEQVERYQWLASRLAPFDPQIKSDLGRLHESRVLAALEQAELAVLSEEPTDEFSMPDISADAEVALEYYRQAVSLRPANAQDWANLALLKVTQEDIDAEFAHAAQRALTLGPWQSAVQAGIAGGGLTVWEELPAALQADIADSVQRGLATDSRLMVLVARRFSLFEAQSQIGVSPGAAGESLPEG